MIYCGEYVWLEVIGNGRDAIVGVSG